MATSELTVTMGIAALRAYRNADRIIVACAVLRSNELHPRET